MTRIIQMTQPGCNAGKQVAGRLNKKIENSIFALIYLHKVQYHNGITPSRKSRFIQYLIFDTETVTGYWLFSVKSHNFVGLNS